MAERPEKRPVSSIEVPVDTQFNGSTDFVLSDYDHDGKKGCCHMCRMKMIYRRLPILTWLPKYSTADAIGDLVAGLTVGMTVIPQGLAYSSIAGLPPEFGLYGAFMGCLVYVVLGSCKDSTIGSTAVASLLVGQSSGGVWQRAVLLTFITGLIEVLMGILRLGFLVDFVSGPVNSGFTSAVALIILTSQMKNLINVRTTGSTFVEMWTSVIKNINKAHIPDTALGLGSITFLLIFRWIGSLRVGPKDDKLKTCKQRFINKLLWIMGISRNGILVITSALIGWYLERIGNQQFTLVGKIPQGVPRISLPPFSIPEIRGNDTNGEEIIIQHGETFTEMIGHLGSGLIVVPMIALLENISVCKAFASNKPIDATQELFAMGFSNIGNSLFQGYRANGGLARSAVNNASGVRTPLSNLYIGSIVILALTYLTPYFFFIPKATLAAVIIAAVIFTIQYNVIVPMWRSKKIDLIPGFGAFIACLVLPLQIGIFVGIGINMVFILYYSARPKVNLNALETSCGQTFLMLTPDRCLIFPSVEFVRNVINKSGMKTNVPVVVDCTYVYGADYTAAKAIATMVKDFNTRNQKIIFYNLKPSVAQVFEGVATNLILCYSKSELEIELTTNTAYIEAY
ncbi:sodium-independent sulfate anion transporter-like [Episyrphus balteatus]|uniref:sodium-independent sulfate anion transporter-like n=1 Tax=Episyrphus balteatus TaxID=286459 RepID=UPI0024855628|nr:sodium-independent sulfate anion transporter-like [Episyrphus balteatus]